MFSHKFMDKVPNKILLLISLSIVYIQCATYAFNLPIAFIIAITLMTKHPASMLYITISLKVVNTLISEKQQITALAVVATLKNLVSIIFQNIAGHILDATSYSYLYTICFICMIIGVTMVIFFKIDSGKDNSLFN